MKENVETIGPANGAVMDSPAGALEAAYKKHMHRIKIPAFIKRPKPGACTVDIAPKEVVLDFEENLKQNRLAEAGQQLISREESIFSLGVAKDEVSREEDEVSKEEDEEDRLHKDYETLMVHVWMAVHASFGEEGSETLRSAITAILQEEEQDRRWEEVRGEAPVWRPRRCRFDHDKLLRNVVEARMRRAEEEVVGGDELSTSMKREACRKGKRLQGDLLRVVRDVSGCYPPEFNVCSMYARLYHQAFSTRLSELARSGLDLDDCIYILCWVNDYYPTDVLKHNELEVHISSDSLGPLLAEEDLKPLEEQYLSHKETKVRTWVSNALKKEEEDWQSGKSPEVIDGYCFCTVALDVIQVVDGAVREAKAILGGEGKTQRILCQLEGFLTSYKKSLEELIKVRRENTTAVMKANLVSIEQLRDYIVKRESLFSEETKASCLSIIEKLKDCCYRYLTNPIHEELKILYRKLWTQAWFSGSQEVFGEILGTLEEKMHHFRDLKPICREELLGRLHMEVMVEYVKRLFKRKLKLRDREQQETAARLLCEDSKRLNTLFTEVGSKESWLDKVLLKMAEVIRLQDPGSIQLEIVTLARDYPDLSERQVLALLHLKSNLSSSDIRRIKESLTENRDSLSSLPAPPFFSKVPVKWSL